MAFRVSLSRILRAPISPDVERVLVTGFWQPAVRISPAPVISIAMRRAMPAPVQAKSPSPLSLGS